MQTATALCLTESEAGNQIGLLYRCRFSRCAFFKKDPSLSRSFNFISLGRHLYTSCKEENSAHENVRLWKCQDNVYTFPNLSVWTLVNIGEYVKISASVQHEPNQAAKPDVEVSPLKSVASLLQQWRFRKNCVVLSYCGWEHLILMRKWMLRENRRIKKKKKNPPRPKRVKATTCGTVCPRSIL